MSGRDWIDEASFAVRLPPDRTRSARYLAACDALRASSVAALVDVCAPDTGDGMHPGHEHDWSEAADALREALRKAGGR